jgi:uncharacterized protein (DUF58 family)
MPSRRATLILAVAMVLAAAMFDAPELYVVGVGLLLARAAARVWVRLAASGARLEHTTGPRTIVEGEAYPLRLVVRGGRVRLAAATVTHPLAARAASVGRRRDAPAALELAGLKRGWQRIKPPTLVLADPLGLATTDVGSTEESSVLVLPRIEEIVVQSGNGDWGGEEAVAAGANDAYGAGLGKRAVDFEIDGLRMYRPGTPASRIHWPILARTGELVERRLVGGADASPIVVVDAHQPRDAVALDRAVRAAASLCFHLAPSRGCALILPEQRSPLWVDQQLRSWPQAHASLALVEACASPLSTRVRGLVGTVFWVTAASDVPSLPSLPPGSRSYLVAAFAPGLDAPAFMVAGCEGHALEKAKPRARARVG